MRSRTRVLQPGASGRDAPQPDRDRDRDRRASCAPRSPSERRAHDLRVVVGEAEQRARDRRAEHADRLPARSRSGSGTGPRPRAKMMIPPIVGVPAFAWWPSGPSSRMCWPNSRSRRNSMNFGLRKMQISSEAVPAIRIAPIRRSTSTRTAPARERLGDASRPTPREAFTSTVSPGASSSGTSAAASPASADAVRLAVERRRPSRPRAAPTATSTSTPRVGRVRADLAVEARARRGRARACRRAPRRGAPSRGGRGEVVEGGAHRHRVGVVAVVDHGHPAGQLRRRSPAHRRERDRRRAPPATHADRPRGGDRGEQVARADAPA